MKKLQELIDKSSETLLKKFKKRYKLEEIDITKFNQSQIDHMIRFLEKLFNPSMEEIKKESWEKLRECDWTQLADEPLDQEDRKKWRDYRVYLGNIEQLWKDKQIQILEVKDFEDWLKNKPKFKPKKKRWYLDD